MGSKRPPEVEEEYVWNLAIGSNMDEARLRARGGNGRRNIDPLTPPIPASAEGWAMTMDMLFLPPTEPVMAGAVRRKGATMHGILYKLTRFDYETLTLTEGCKLSTSLYKEEALDVVPYPAAVGEHVAGGVVRAVVFSLRYPLATPLSEMRLYPSARYKKMLVDGAIAAKLNKSYVSALHDMGAAPPVSPRMRGFTGFCMIGCFFLYKSTRLMLLMRHYYRPAIAWAYSKSAEAEAGNKVGRQYLFWILMVAMMFPVGCIGFVRALGQRRDVLKIARGES